ncbi:hypothetical protein BANRA_05953 [Klebsiella variicola]|nr:hypothetical protein BANRA_05953 [Klebsiella variicola]
MNNTVIACVDGSPSTRPVQSMLPGQPVTAPRRCCTCSKRVRLRRLT